ncbi:MAG: NAD(P)H-hydrate dehydratase [Woeseiaceae bacterium]|nr:NAD(P)H-hydrate dehydratase [Woeseiaceae bacterium]
MNSLPVDIYTVATVREIDRSAIEDNGIPGYALMSRAGAAAVAESRARYPEAMRWVIVCGAGNNGGDGYVVARLAAEQGADVTVLALVDPQRLSGDAATAHRDFVASGGSVEPWSGALPAGAELLVDGILGSGLERDVGGEFANAVEAMNAHGAPIVALDIPTGLHGDSGVVMGCAIRAALTVTFVGLKTGLFLGMAPDFVGELVFAGLDIPDDVKGGPQAALRRIDTVSLARALPPRPRLAHKGDHGHVLIVGGGEGMPGAVRLAGEAALRTGAGLVSVATHPSHAAVVVAGRPELMSHPVSTPKDLDGLLDRADVVAFGPGLGQTDWARALFGVVDTCGKPCVWDADALNLLAEAPGTSDARIITPHPGEAGRLLESTAGAVQADRPAALRKLAKNYGGIAVLKGAGSLVSSAEGAPWICTAGNPGMAAAGMGDVLTGVIAALLAQGHSIENAAAFGVQVHAMAGDRAALAGQRGLVATDLIAELRTIVNPS